MKEEIRYKEKGIGHKDWWNKSCTKKREECKEYIENGGKERSTEKDIWKKEESGKNI